MEPANPLLDDDLLARTGQEHPRLALLPTASADSDSVIARFYDAFSRKARCSHLRLFQRDRPVEMLLDQDAIFVSGGNTANLLAIWRVHGVDAVLRKAWRQGTVLAGASAGALCWFEGGVTDSFGPDLAALRDGLGFLKGSFCPHYNEPARRAAYTDLVARGELAPGVAASDGAALCFRDTSLAEAVTSRPEARAWRVGGGGIHVEIPVRHLGSPAPDEAGPAG
jgi:dipeptidase E